jgi:hypothetical protein
MNREYRVVARTGENHSVREERKIVASSAHAAAKQFASEFGEEPYPGRQEHPNEAGSVWSFGWSGHGQRIYVYEG